MRICMRLTGSSLNCSAIAAADNEPSEMSLLCVCLFI